MENNTSASISHTMPEKEIDQEEEILSEAVKLTDIRKYGLSPSIEGASRPSIFTSSLLRKWRFEPVTLEKPSSRPSKIILTKGRERSSSSMLGQYVVLKSKTSTNGWLVEDIPKEEAICRFCYKELLEENVMKLNCECPTTIAHEECATKWSRVDENRKCNHCMQELQIEPSTLAPPTPSVVEDVPKRTSVEKGFEKLWERFKFW